MHNPREQVRQNRLERAVTPPVTIGVLFGEYGVPGADGISSRIMAVAAREGLFESISLIPLKFSGPIMRLDEDGTIPAVLTPSLGLLGAAAESASCDIVVPAAHTIHFFRDTIASGSVFSMVDVALDEASRRREANGVSKVGVIGYSSTTLIRELYEGPLRERGMEFVTIPSPMSGSLDQAIDGFVADKLSLEALITITQSACANLLEQDAQAIILACSELPLGLRLLEDEIQEAIINPNDLIAEVVVAEALKLADERRGNIPKL